MRRKDREITDFNEIINIIKKCDVCRLFHSTLDWISREKKYIYIFIVPWKEKN
ncbi:MAG TPA: hypothetical protein PLK68_07085 [Thomasclavelia ramosa]|nr:hypothetical protein [Thomasclavelia ramosa]